MPKLEKVVDLPTLQVFADSVYPSTTKIMELLWLGEEFHGQRIRLEGIALETFLAMMQKVPPATMVRELFTNGGFRDSVLNTSGASVVKPDLVAV